MDIFMAWSDRKWVLDGAAVRISIVGFGNAGGQTPTLDGTPVAHINADLTTAADLTSARRLQANATIAYMADTKGGRFDIDGDLASAMLTAPNPHGRPNSHVLKPWWNGLDVVRRPRGMWIIDFGCETPEREAVLYEAPYEYVRRHVMPVRITNRRASYAARWWLHVEPRPAMRAALSPLARYVATAIVAKHRLFAWVPREVLADHQLIVFAREDDYFMGVVHSRLHEAWALSICSALEDRPRYTPTTCFETFPFPVPTEEQREAIAAAAKALTDMRESALANDPKLTLTALYNKRPTWLDNLHKDLDRAVLAAYGWPEDIGDEEMLERLLALNHERAAEEERGILRRP